MGDPFLDEKPRPKPSKHEIGQDLSLLSVHELDERVAQLEEEISRLKAMRASKEASRSEADSFFKR
jgi:uncharacterized small protein (DUF1192 family)